MNQWFIAAAWVGLAFAASLISIRTAVSVALVEILVGVVAGNFLQLPTAEWITFLAGFGSILLTFMAGAEVEPNTLRRYLKESLAIGFFSFLMPFLGAAAYCYYVAGWTPAASWIGGIALSTTSVAVVYAVMVETRLNETPLGKVILAACFITDLGTVLALGVIFANYNLWLIMFAAVTVLTLLFAPRLIERLVERYGSHVSEPGTKLIFLLLFALGGVALKANSEAVLPAYLLGLAVATVFAQQREMVRRLRTTVFAFLTPFYFLRAGALVSLPALAGAAGLALVLLFVKVVAKFMGVWPWTRAFRFTSKQGSYTTLLMSTGLTFGSISALFGFNRGLITQAQYTVLVSVVIASAVVPTLIAQAWFRPTREEADSFGEPGGGLKQAEGE
ncbi:MAG: cation:proton antiporter [Armatimonadetes bacterium]|nr:cation:proton antiporter [Armatimonadota bacterium]